MFRKIKRVVASIVLACGVFSLTAVSSASVSAMWVPAVIHATIPVGIHVASRVAMAQTARAAVDAALDAAYEEFWNPPRRVVYPPLRTR